MTEPRWEWKRISRGDDDPAALAALAALKDAKPEREDVPAMSALISRDGKLYDVYAFLDRSQPPPGEQSIQIGQIGPVAVYRFDGKHLIREGSQDYRHGPDHKAE
jgi:hypothetical protein